MTVRGFQVQFRSRLDDFFSIGIESSRERCERKGRQVPLLLTGVFDHSSNLLPIQLLSLVHYDVKTIFPVSLLNIR